MFSHTKINFVRITCKCQDPLLDDKMKNPIFVKMFMFLNKNAMKAEELEKIQEEIENKIFAWANDCGLASDDLDAISDGVADCAAYLNSSPRVAWILKEPYDDIDETTGSYSGGGWSLSKLLRDSTTFDNKTWQGITTYIMTRWIMSGVIRKWEMR